MIAITRFDRDMDGHMSAELDGSWVRYDSHDKVVSELNEQMLKQSTEAANEFNLHHEAMLVEMDKQAAANGVQAEACGECGAIHATGANSLCDK